jgi:hypothetical protein
LFCIQHLLSSYREKQRLLQPLKHKFFRGALMQSLDLGIVSAWEVTRNLVVQPFQQIRSQRNEQTNGFEISHFNKQDHKTVTFSANGLSSTFVSSSPKGRVRQHVFQTKHTNFQSMYCMFHVVVICHLVASILCML